MNQTKQARIASTVRAATRAHILEASTLRWRFDGGKRRSTLTRVAEGLVWLGIFGIAALILYL